MASNCFPTEIEQCEINSYNCIYETILMQHLFIFIAVVHIIVSLGLWRILYKFTSSLSGKTNRNFHSSKVNRNWETW